MDDVQLDGSDNPAPIKTGPIDEYASARAVELRQRESPAGEGPPSLHAANTASEVLPEKPTETPKGGMAMLKDKWAARKKQKVDASVKRKADIKAAEKRKSDIARRKASTSTTDDDKLVDKSGGTTDPSPKQSDEPQL